MTPTRRKQFDQAVKDKRIKVEDGKHYVLCNDCTGRKRENVYHVVRKKKLRSIEECCMDAKRLGVFTCKYKTREKL